MCLLQSICKRGKALSQGGRQSHQWGAKPRQVSQVGVAGRASQSPEGSEWNFNKMSMLFSRSSKEHKSQSPEGSEWNFNYAWQDKCMAPFKMGRNRPKALSGTSTQPRETEAVCIFPWVAIARRL